MASSSSPQSLKLTLTSKSEYSVLTTSHFRRCSSASRTRPGQWKILGMERTTRRHLLSYLEPSSYPLPPKLKYWKLTISQIRARRCSPASRTQFRAVSSSSHAPTTTSCACATSCARRKRRSPLWAITRSRATSRAAARGSSTGSASFCCTRSARTFTTGTGSGGSRTWCFTPSRSTPTTMLR